MIKSEHIWAGAAGRCRAGNGQRAKCHGPRCRASSGRGRRPGTPHAATAGTDCSNREARWRDGRWLGHERHGSRWRQDADDGMKGGADMPMGCMAGGGMPMAADIEGQIGSLRSELKIADLQAGAWNAFAEVLRANAKRAGPVHAAMMSASGGAALPSLERRLELHEQALTAGLANLRTLKPALVNLYAVLSAEQKMTADRLLVHETGMMPSMQMGGMPMSGRPSAMPRQ